MSILPPDLPMRPGYTPRRWQTEALTAILAAWREGCRRPLLSVATGSGKGDFIAGFARRAANRGSRIVILVHLEQLVTDLWQRIRMVPGAGGDPGMVMGGSNDLRAQIVVASVQSMRQPDRLERLGRTDIVVTDEAHHAPADGYRAVLDAVAAERAEARCARPLMSVGLTATPYRAGSGGETEGLGDMYDALVYSYTMADGVADGVLVPPVVWRYDIATTGGPGEAVRRIDSPEMCTVVAEQWAARARGRRCLAFGVDRRHAERIADAVRKAGGTAEAVDGSMPWRMQQDRIAAFRAGKLDVLASCDLIREGFDAPIADALLIARPSESPIVGLQMLGRGLRSYPGKVDCLVLDMTGGRIDMDLSREADLSTGRSARDQVSPARPLEVGETVIHRHREDLGLGEVVAVGEAVVRVQWAAGELVHGAIELIRRSREDHEQAALQVVSVQGLQVEILPWPVGSGPRPSVIGWYAGRRQGGDRPDWSAAARVVRPGQPPGAAVAIVLPGSAGWLPWLVVTVPGADGHQVTTCHRLGEGRPVAQLDHARLLGETALRSVRGVEIAPMTAGGDSEPLSPELRQRLRAAGVRPDHLPETRAEGRALLYACGARLAVADHLRTLKRQYVAQRPTAVRR